MNHKKIKFRYSIFSLYTTLCNLVCTHSFKHCFIKLLEYTCREEGLRFAFWLFGRVNLIQALPAKLAKIAVN